jgi:hypothetical protein
VFFVLSLERRRVIQVNVTEQPTAEWMAQQIVEAVGPDVGLARLIRDRDKIFDPAGTARPPRGPRVAALAPVPGVACWGSEVVASSNGRTRDQRGR